MIRDFFTLLLLMMKRIIIMTAYPLNYHTIPLDYYCLLIDDDDDDHFLSIHLHNVQFAVVIVFL